MLSIFAGNDVPEYRPPIQKLVPGDNGKALNINLIVLYTLYKKYIFTVVVIINSRYWK